LIQKKKTIFIILIIYELLFVTCKKLHILIHLFISVDLFDILLIYGNF